MPLRVKIQVALTILAAASATALAARLGSASWISFWLLLIAVLFSSGLKVALPRGDGTMSLNFPFILLGIVQLSPLQAMLLAAISVAAQCRIRVHKMFTVVQILFNVANAMLSTASAYVTFVGLERRHIALAPALAAASVTYFVWNTCSVAMVLAATKGESVVRIWREEYPWYLPFYVVGAVLAAAISLLSVRFGWSTALLLLPVVYTLHRAYTSQISRLHERQQHLEETEALHLRAIEGLAMAIEAKDQNTHDHLFRVRQYVKAVGEELKLSALELKALETAAFLHDIGKLAVPEQIINKPGKLTPEEFEKMKIHPVVGADILERVRFPYPVVPIVRSHHEWWDGSGYPDGLQGEAIPIGARILTVVDCFDALTSDRPYRKGMTDEAALGLLEKLTGTQFDPRVVEAFRRCYTQVDLKSTAIEAAKFTPLNTEVAVWRGDAPGAGFEAGSQPGAMKTGLDARGHALLEVGVEEAAPRLLIADQQHASDQALQAAQLLANSNKMLTADPLLAHLDREVGCDAGVLFEIKGDLLVARWSGGLLAKQIAACSIVMGEGISGWVAQTGKTILNANASVEPGCPVDENGAYQLLSALSIPLSGEQGCVVAVLTLYSTGAEAYRREDLHKVQLLEPRLHSLLKSEQQADQELREERDYRTGLRPSRDLFLKLEAALNCERQMMEGLAVVTCGLEVVESSGRPTHAEEIKRAVRLAAEALRVMQTGEIVLFQLHDDAFALLLEKSTQEMAVTFSARVRGVLQHALRECGFASTFQPVCGFAVCPADGITVEDLLSAAERRMRSDVLDAHQLEAAPCANPTRMLQISRPVSCVQ